MKPSFHLPTAIGHAVCALLPICILLLGMYGCASTATAPAPSSRQQVIADAVEDTLSIGLVPVLSKNPSYIPTARSISAALAAFTGDTITPADISALLDKTNLAPEDRDAVAGLVNAAWATYCKRYAQGVNANLRPDVRLFLGAVKNGIDSAVAALPAAR